MRNNLLIKCEIGSEKDKIFLISEDGKRHHIQSPEIAKENEIDLTKVKIVSEDEIYSHPLSYSIAKNNVFDEDSIVQLDNKNNIVQKVGAYDWHFFGSRWKGHGLEFSAASSPWPCSLKCHVDYSDPYDEEEGCKIGYENKDFVPLDYISPLEDMSNIEKNDYDFICCSHVIEHTPYTIKSIKNVYEHLKFGGEFVMAIPHMDYTFDQYRELTSLDHFIKDYQQPEKIDNLIHLIEYTEKATNKYQGLNVDITNICKSYLLGVNHDIHWHTFTEKNFFELISWFNENVYTWNCVEIYQRSEGSIEFFVRLIK